MRDAKFAPGIIATGIKHGLDVPAKTL